MMAATIMGAVYFVIGRWVTGRPRAFIAAAIAGAYLTGRLHQAFEEGGWDMLLRPELLIVIAAIAVALAFFALRTDRGSTE
ncbi:MAG: hypothetical protein HRT63_11455 [Erythrobacter sp.]|nr:hypothetical protein [Erythrobacter sp.]